MSLDPKSEVSVIQFYHELMKWAKTHGVSPAEARELRDAYLSMYEVLPDIMPDVTPEQFGQEYIQNWRENGMEPSDDTPKTFNYAPGNGWEEYKDLDEMAGRTCASCEEGHHERCRDESCDCCGGNPRAPRMSEIFKIRESPPIQNRPPPGSKPLKDTEWNKMGAMGQALHTGLDAMKKAGQEMTVYDTPQGERMAYPKDAAPGRGPMKADDTKGVWTPVTGSSATGTPFSSQAPTTTMK